MPLRPLQLRSRATAEIPFVFSARLRSIDRPIGMAGMASSPFPATRAKKKKARDRPDLRCFQDCRERPGTGLFLNMRGAEGRTENLYTKGDGRTDGWDELLGPQRRRWRKCHGSTMKVESQNFQSLSPKHPDRQSDTYSLSPPTLHSSPRARSPRQSGAIDLALAFFAPTARRSSHPDPLRIHHPGS